MPEDVSADEHVNRSQRPSNSMNFDRPRAWPLTGPQRDLHHADLSGLFTMDCDDGHSADGFES